MNEEQKQSPAIPRPMSAEQKKQTAERIERWAIVNGDQILQTRYGTQLFDSAEQAAKYASHNHRVVRMVEAIDAAISTTVSHPSEARTRQ